MSAAARLELAKKTLKGLQSDYDYKQEELDDLEEKVVRQERKVETLEGFKNFTYGTGVSWDGRLGIVVGILDDYILVVAKDADRYIEERVDMKWISLKVLEFEAGRILFDEIRDRGWL